MKKHGDGADREGGRGSTQSVDTAEAHTCACAPEHNLHTPLIGALMRLLFP